MKHIKLNTEIDDKDGCKNLVIKVNIEVQKLMI